MLYKIGNHFPESATPQKTLAQVSEAIMLELVSLKNSAFCQVVEVMVMEASFGCENSFN